MNQISMEETVDLVTSWSGRRESRYVCVSNVHMCMEVADNEAYGAAINRSDLTVPDGRPIYWALHLLGFKGAKQIRGEDLTLAVCAAAEEKGIPVGFFGGTPELLDQIRDVLLTRFPKLELAILCAPPFRPITAAENATFTENINASGVGVLFVGLGCPKQEDWMAAHKHSVHAVMIGVGAAFDFISGNKKSAPAWLNQIGLEWLFRLISEPRRLWKRYFLHNPRFIVRFFRQLVQHRKLTAKNDH
ncbi:MAG: WecB/TagA/CpsF family glycosyltransferase [Halioglobus sp.]